MASSKEVKQLIRQLKRDGYPVVHGGKHIKVLDGEKFLFGISHTPKGHAWKAIQRDARRAGCLER